MCIKFESRKICVAGNQCDNSDFDFHNAEHKELPVIKRASGKAGNRNPEQEREQEQEQEPEPEPEPEQEPAQEGEYNQLIEV